MSGFLKELAHIALEALRAEVVRRAIQALLDKLEDWLRNARAEAAASA